MGPAGCDLCCTVLHGLNLTQMSFAILQFLWYRHPVVKHSNTSLEREFEKEKKKLSDTKMHISILKISTVKYSHLDLRICRAIIYFNLKAYLRAVDRTYLIKNSWKYDTIIRGQSKTTFHSPSNKLHAGRAKGEVRLVAVFPTKIHASNSPGRQKMGFPLSQFLA